MLISHFHTLYFFHEYSLVICAAYEKRIKRKLITLIIYPQDKVGNPIVNPSGRYVVRLWLNGVARSVEVDDFFPVDRHGNILCSHTNCKAAFELWVCLIEKAYMKLCKLNIIAPVF